MGYRHYLNSLPKETYEEIKDKSQEELIEKYGEPGENYFWPHGDLKDLNMLYELGKYIDFDYQPFTQNALTYECGDTEFLIANEDMFLALIKHYQVKVKNIYADLFDEANKKDVNEIDMGKIKSHFADMLTEWAGLIPYDVRPDRPLVSSWKYEYAQFELVKLYKEFDWENNVLILTGH